MTNGLSYEEDTPLSISELLKHVNKNHTFLQILADNYQKVYALSRDTFQRFQSVR